jgi:hypothetical protein
MGDVRAELEQKRTRLAGLKESRSKANCSTKYSSAAQMQRELEIEELEDEIKTLEQKVKA